MQTRRTCRTGLSRGLLLTMVAGAILMAGVAMGQGLLPTPPSEAGRFQRAAAAIGAATVRGSADLSPRLPPIGNQEWGSCAAWAVGYYYKTVQEAQEHGWSVATADHQFNPYFIYNQANHGEDGGLTFPWAFDVLCQKGCATRADMPFNGQDYWTWPTPDEMEKALPYRADAYAYVFLGEGTGGAALPAMKALLDSGRIFVMAIPVYDDFMDESGLPAPGYLYGGPSYDAEYLGGHAVTIVGYDDSRGALKMANSWGTGWGNGGYCWLSYDFVSQYAWEAWTMTDRLGYQVQATARFDITHTYRADLTVVVGVGDPSNPIWSSTPYDGDGGDGHDIHATVDLTEGVAHLPPSSSNGWFLRVIDDQSQDGGTVDSFRIHCGSQAYAASDLPLWIDDSEYCEVVSRIAGSSNQPPSQPQLAIAPAAPGDADNVKVTISGSQDPDGDPITYWIGWSVSQSGQWVQKRGRITSRTYDVLPASLTSPGQAWKCTVIATDNPDPNVQPDHSRAVEKRLTIVAGQPPTTPTLTVTPATPSDASNVTARASGCTDPDRDPITYAFGWAVQVGQQWVQKRGRVTANPYDVLPASMTTPGQSWKCYVVATDGTNRTPVVGKWFAIGSSGVAGAAGPACVTSLSAVPTAMGAEIVYTLSAPAQVRAEVLNIAGVPVRLVTPRTDGQAGVNTLTWNGQTDAGLRAPNGRYLVRVTAQGEDGTSSQALGTVAVQR